MTRLSGVGRRRGRSANVVVLVQLDADGVRELLLVLGLLQRAGAVIDMALAAARGLLSFSSADDRQSALNVSGLLGSGLIVSVRSGGSGRVGAERETAGLAISSFSEATDWRRTSSVQPPSIAASAAQTTIANPLPIAATSSERDFS